MAYRVSITPRAERDFAEVYSFINAEDSEAAHKWYRGLKEVVLGLEEHPDRYALTPEDKGLRHLLYGNKPHIYRVIYRVSKKEKQVLVLHVRHGARQEFESANLE